MSAEELEKLVKAHDEMLEKLCHLYQIVLLLLLLIALIPFFILPF